MVTGDVRGFDDELMGDSQVRRMKGMAVMESDRPLLIHETRIRMDWLAHSWPQRRAAIMMG